MAAKKSAPKPSAAAVRKALAAPAASADSLGLLSDIIDVWGGTRQLALDLVTEFKSAGEGTPTRQRILEMVQRLVIATTQQDLAKPRRPEDLDDADLQVVIQTYLSRLSAAPASQDHE